MTMQQAEWQQLLHILESLGLTIGRADRSSGQILVVVPSIPARASDR